MMTFISIHAPAWGATRYQGPRYAADRISIHAPAWGATVGSVRIVSAHVLFQSTLPRGERQVPGRQGNFQRHFNPRSRVGSDTGSRPSTWPMPYFNPRSRVGSDLIIHVSVEVPDGISIHAPAWGATVMLLTFGPCSGFQSTLPRGERLSDIVCGVASYRFQSTLPRGERLVLVDRAIPAPKISIHAPAWGATHICGIVVSLPNNFNPRSRVGSDGHRCGCAPGRRISIHAPAWGATYSSVVCGSSICISIHAPAWGATLITKSLS